MSCVFAKSLYIGAAFAFFQPEDWDDKEKIPDPEDKKPEVFHSLSCTMLPLWFLVIYDNRHPSELIAVFMISRVMMTSQRKFLILMLRRYHMILLEFM